MTLNLCYRGKRVKETMCQIILQETVWGLVTSAFLCAKLVILKDSIISKVVVFQMVYHLKVRII